VHKNSKLHTFEVIALCSFPLLNFVRSITQNVFCIQKATDLKIHTPIDLIKATVLQILLENREFCKYAKISLYIHIIVDLNQNIALNLHMFTVLLRKQTIRVSAIGIYLL